MPQMNSFERRVIWPVSTGVSVWECHTWCRKSCYHMNWWGVMNRTDFFKGMDVWRMKKPKYFHTSTQLKWFHQRKVCSRHCNCLHFVWSILRPETTFWNQCSCIIHLDVLCLLFQAVIDFSSTPHSWNLIEFCNLSQRTPRLRSILSFK